MAGGGIFSQPIRGEVIPAAIRGLIPHSPAPKQMLGPFQGRHPGKVAEHSKDEAQAGQATGGVLP